MAEPNYVLVTESEREELFALRVTLDDTKRERDKLAATIAAYLGADERAVHDAANLAHARDERDALRATVERVRATWRYIADTMATSSRDWSETATDAWLYGAIVGWGDGPDDPDEAWTAMAAVWWDADDVAQLKEIHATIAALDAQRPAEGGPEPAARAFRRCTGCGDDIWPGEPSGDVCAICRVQTPPPSPPRTGRFEELLAAEHEQFDQRGELLKSITEYKDAPSGTVSAPPPSPEGEGARTGVELIAVERRRQVEAEGWTPEHDAEHVRDQLARAAVCYATPPERRSMRWHNVSATFGAPPDRGDRHVHAPADWPWHPDWWKPRDRLRDLVRAGALIAAEIDRLAALDGGPEGEGAR